MRHHHRLFAGLLIVLFSLFTTSSLVAFGFEEGGTGSNSCNAQAADSGYANLPPYSKDVTDSSTAQAADSGYANLPPYSKDVTDSTTTSTAQTAGSGDADVPPYMEHVVVDSQTDHANVPTSTNGVTDAGWWVGYPGAGEPDSGYANLPPYSKDVTDSSPVIAAETEVAEISVPIAVAPAAYAAHTELFAVADDCQEILAPVPTWIEVEVEGQAPTSTATATCSRCESTAF